MKPSWPLALLLSVIFIGLVYLVHQHDMSNSVIEAFVAAVVGGGVVHFGSKLSGQ